MHPSSLCDKIPKKYQVNEIKRNRRRNRGYHMPYVRKGTNPKKCFGLLMWGGFGLL